MRFLLLILFSLTFLNAHNLKIFTTRDAGILEVYAYFNKNAPCMECNVSVENRTSSELFTLKTNDKGKAKIPLSIKPTKVTVTADLGHKNSLVIMENLKTETTVLPYPFWAKILFALFVIGIFFVGFYWAKRR